MFVRLVAALLALTLLVASGVASSVSYRCLMDGNVRAECCCKKSETKRPSNTPKAEPDDGCCELEVTQGTALPATARDGVANESATLPLLAILPTGVDVPPARGAGDTLSISARGPPSPTGPPLFLFNCSFLI